MQHTTISIVGKVEVGLHACHPKEPALHISAALYPEIRTRSKSYNAVAILPDLTYASAPVTIIGQCHTYPERVLPVCCQEIFWGGELPPRQT